MELTMALLTPAGRTGMTFHRAARDLRKPPFEATIGGSAALGCDVYAAFARSGR